MQIPLDRSFMPGTQQGRSDGPADGVAWVASAIVFAVALAFMPLLWKPWVHGNDGARNYAYLRSAWMDGDLDFTNEFAHFRTLGEMASADKIGASDPQTGKPGNALGIGSAILWSPFFAVGHAIAWMTDSPMDGYSKPYVWAICFASTLYAAMGLALLAFLLTRYMGLFAAIATILFVWFGTPLFFYMYLHPSMSHANSFFLASLLVWEYDLWRDRQSRLHFFLMGITGGLIVITRFSDGALLLVPLFFWLRSMANPERNFGSYGTYKRPVTPLLGGALLAAGVLLAFVPQVIAWQSFYGQWFSGPRDYGLAQNLSPLWKSPHFFDLMFSGWRGLFVWSPVLIFAVIGFALLTIRQPRLLYWSLALAAFIQLWIIGGWTMWWGGASFGQRFFINLAPLFAFGLAYLLSMFSRPVSRILCMVVLSLSLLWSLGLAIQYISGMIPRENPVKLSQLAQNQWKRVPGWILDHSRLLLPGERLAKGNMPAKDNEQ